MADPNQMAGVFGANPDDLPFFLRTGLVPQPPNISPTRAGLMHDVQPLIDNSRTTPGWDTAIGAGLMMAPGIGRYLGAAMRAAPKTAGSALTASGLLGATSATGGDDEFKWTDQNAERADEMKQLQARINERASRINTLATTKTNSPAGTQKMAIEQLTAQNNTDTGRLEALRGQQSEDRNKALEQWQAKTQSEKPFRQEWPDAYRGLPLAGWGLSALGGLAGARGGSPFRSMLGGAAGGTIASTAAAVGPTAYDAATLPTGSKYQQQAYDWLRDPNYYTGRVLPEVGVGMLLGALGGKWGATMKSSPKGIPVPLAPAAPSPAMDSREEIAAALAGVRKKGARPDWMRGPKEPPQPDPFFHFER